ncbi:type II secretion system protein GspL [Actimicrobium sp. CCC2.4]|uniref:type II secretion system protein GspL n=1 Tax=Actimicrobium sp. CCC2.4 TaxID=3048606 RepID=UPI002AC89A8C|nr:type II secretion system protein GspL [Actimicrobium sp. CCC2.4]MEB0134200.1 type II secretion system protein GspL [Actimicrobium sp. CCC2.4]WPX32853.1 type II secretion system protein GspL [Actimicrobium sp. CCC2.4]
MSTLYIRLLSKAAADCLDEPGQLGCAFALVADGGSIEREGAAVLADLRPVIAQSQRVTLLLAASDVTLLRIRVPPLSAARLRTALPNMLEEKLMTDPAECVIVAGGTADGLRTVAVVQRAWLERLVHLFTGLGARHLSALPAQLCVPHQAGVVSAVIVEHAADLELVIRLNEQDGLGIAVLPDQAASALQETLQTLCAVVPQAPIALYLTPSSVPACQALLEDGQHERITLFADNWLRWVTAARGVTLNLMNGLGVAGGSGLNWQPWRWAIGLAAVALLVNVTALNVEWLRMKREANGLQGSMIQTYKTAYPKETAIIDPVVQMRQKIAAGQRASGQAAPDDFTSLLAAFSEAWNSVMQGNQSLVIAGIEYHDRGLLIKLKPDAQPPLDQIKAALTQRQLSLSQQNAGVWQIRSSK